MQYGFHTVFLCIQHSERLQPSYNSYNSIMSQPPPHSASPASGSASARAHYRSELRKRPRVPYAIPRAQHAKEFSRSDQPRIEPGAGNRGGSMRGWTATLLTARQSGCSVGQTPLERKNARAAFSRELPVPSLVSATASAQGGIGKDTSGRSMTRIRLSRFVWIISLRRSLRHTERTRSCQLVCASDIAVCIA